MTNYTLPNHTGIASITIRQSQRVRLSESRFNYVQQVLNYGGQRWEADVRIPIINHADARDWLAFLSKLKGPLNTFTMGDPVAATARGTPGGTPLVNGASQTGSSLIIDGCSLSQTDWLKAGDYIQLGTGEDARMHMVLDDVNSDGSGDATLSLWPDITSAPADNATVTVSSTVGAWRLSSPVLQWDTAPPSLYNIEFSAVSVVS